MKRFSKLFSVLGIVFALLVVSAPARSAEKGYPNREIEIVVPFVTGGMVDVATRVINDELSKNLGVPVVVVNKTGAGGTIGAQYVSKAAPDGYTIMGGPHSLFVLVPVMMKNLPYNPTDFVPIARIVTSPFLFAVRKNAPWKTLEEFIAYAKKNPGKTSCATAGVATGSHFILEMLKLEAGVDIQHVPFKGGGQQNAALLGGHVDIDSTTLNPALPLIRSGDMRVLASAEKLKEFPNVPTLAEKGYPGAALASWVGYVGPKGLDKAKVDRLADALGKAVKSPRVIKALEDTGSQIDFVAKDDFRRDIERDLKRLGAVVKKANISMDMK